VDKDAKVVITTIQRLYSMLQGKELEEEAEEDVTSFFKRLHHQLIYVKSLLTLEMLHILKVATLDFI